MDIEEQIEDKAFNDTLRRLDVASDKKDFDIQNIEAELDSLVKYEGLDQTGRGAVKSAEISGAILAYQAFIMRHKKGPAE